MSRPAETYRGARRNAWRSCVGLVDSPGKLWSAYKLDSNWRKPFDDTLIKVVHAKRRGWDYRFKGRAGLNEIRAAWRALRGVS